MPSLIPFIAALSLLLTLSPLSAAPGKNKGPADQAYENANENASFKRDQPKGKNHENKKKNKSGKKGGKHGDANVDNAKPQQPRYRDEGAAQPRNRAQGGETYERNRQDRQNQFRRNEMRDGEPRQRQ